MFNHSIVLLMFFCLFASYFVTHCILTEAPVSHIFVASTLCAAGCAARTYMLFAIASSCDQWPGVIRDAGPFSLNAPFSASISSIISRTRGSLISLRP